MIDGKSDPQVLTISRGCTGRGRTLSPKVALMLVASDIESELRELASPLDAHATRSRSGAKSVSMTRNAEALRAVSDDATCNVSPEESEREP